jgi:hypothetical protein
VTAHIWLQAKNIHNHGLRRVRRPHGSSTPPMRATIVRARAAR